MRRSKLSTIEDEKGNAGLFLESDFCSEHEHGIPGVQGIMNIDKGLVGIDGRTTGKSINYPSVLFGETSAYVWFWIERYHNEEERTLKDLQSCREMGVNKHITNAAGWDEDSIGVWINKKTAPKELTSATQSIVQALTKKEPLVIMLGGKTNPFGGGGLIVVTRAAIDLRPEINQRYLDADAAGKALAAVWEPIGKRLNLMMKTPTFGKYQQRYHSESQYHRNEKYLSVCYLGPKELEATPVKDSIYPFQLWLNPDVQDLYASGWYTVEQIEQWIKGEGPVIEHGTFPRLYKAQEIIAAGGAAYPLDYYALCRCGHIHHDGNASGRKDMLGLKTASERSWSDGRVVVIKECPKCHQPADKMIFSTDDPEHWTNKKKEIA